MQHPSASRALEALEAEAAAARDRGLRVWTIARLDDEGLWFGVEQEQQDHTLVGWTWLCRPRDKATRMATIANDARRKVRELRGAAA